MDPNSTTGEMSSTQWMWTDLMSPPQWPEYFQPVAETVEQPVYPDPPSPNVEEIPVNVELIPPESAVEIAQSILKKHNMTKGPKPPKKNKRIKQNN